MRAAKIELAGRERFLCYTVEAMFQIEEEFGGAQALTKTIEANNREGFASLCRATAILAEQGELARRQMGYEPAPMVDAAAVSASIVHPADLVRLKVAVTSAITLGYGREVDPEQDEVDLGLAELNEQKNRATRAHYIRIGVLCGLTRRETLLSTPGEVWDLWELYLQAHTPRKRREDD